MTGSAYHQATERAEVRVVMREVRAIALGVLVVVLVVTSSVVDLPGGDEVRSWIRGAGAWAPAAFLLLCAGGTAAFFQKPVLATASGLLFGVLPGAGLAIAGFTAGGVTGVLWGRNLLRRAARTS